MKKSILITAAAVAVVLAVVLTAGCVGDNAQQQTAENSTLWMYTDDTGTIVRCIALSDDGNGSHTEYTAEITENGDVEYKVSKDEKITWTKDADGTLNMLRADGEKRTFTIDENRGLLTAESGKVYQLIPSDLSGAVLGLEVTNPAILTIISLYYSVPNCGFTSYDLNYVWKEAIL